MAIWISTLSLVVSICTGGWQVYSWRRTGAILLVWAEESGTEEKPALRVTVTNEGRQPVTVQRVGIRVMARPFRFRRSVGVHRSKVGIRTVSTVWLSEPDKLAGKIEPYDSVTLRVSYEADTFAMLAEAPKLRVVPQAEAAGKYWFGKAVTDL
ncbi:hypothetical protein DMH04_53460 [Kibdelosporangium aridum]|uniref:Uncharacterized protein n=1 Tax=Kibdelosporangium aridum TaxID=2030 RepID=A0A428Y318_KIBAR|nr:hypothetical protein [Kibdelosporangium aridum]RSM61918.1 hypothetical protein DMH04_53460 [Kibdelosporangium aridum]